MDWCASDQRSEAYTLCGLYVTGFIQGVYTAVAVDKEYKSDLLCLPPGVTGTEATAAILRVWRLLEEPRLSATMNASPMVAVAFLLGEAFPCKKSN